MNEMAELGASNAYAELMEVFQRFDEQVAHKMSDQARKDTSMEALIPTTIATPANAGDSGAPGVEG